MSSYLLLLSTGPVMGGFETARAPLALRAVRHLRTAKCDVLDLPQDQPEHEELLYLYRREPGAPRGHVCYRNPSRCLTTLSYEYVGELVPATFEVLEPSDTDRAWWAEQREQAMRAWAMGERFDVPAHSPGTVAAAREQLRRAAELDGQPALW